VYKTEILRSGRSFIETRQYVQTSFFPRLIQMGVLAMPLAPKIVVNEPRRFWMTWTLEKGRLLEEGMLLTLGVDEDNTGNTLVTVVSSLDLTLSIIRAVSFGVATCGVMALVLVPFLFVRKDRWDQNVHKAITLLKADLAV
jgi:hypothetical protein